MSKPNRILISAELLVRGDAVGARQVAAEVAHTLGVTVEHVMVDVTIQANHLKDAQRHQGDSR